MPSKPTYDASDSQQSGSVDSLTGGIEELGIKSVSGSSADDTVQLGARKSERVAKKEEYEKLKKGILEEGIETAIVCNSRDNIVCEDFTTFLVGKMYGEEPFMKEDLEGAKGGKPQEKKKVVSMLAVAG